MKRGRLLVAYGRGCSRTTIRSCLTAGTLPLLLRSHGSCRLVATRCRHLLWRRWCTPLGPLYMRGLLRLRYTGRRLRLTRLLPRVPLLLNRLPGWATSPRILAYRALTRHATDTRTCTGTGTGRRRTLRGAAARPAPPPAPERQPLIAVRRQLARSRPLRSRSSSNHSGSSSSTRSLGIPSRPLTSRANLRSVAARAGWRGAARRVGTCLSSHASCPTRRRQRVPRGAWGPDDILATSCGGRGG